MSVSLRSAVTTDSTLDPSDIWVVWFQVVVAEPLPAIASEVWGHATRISRKLGLLFVSSMSGTGAFIPTMQLDRDISGIRTYGNVFKAQGDSFNEYQTRLEDLADQLRNRSNQRAPARRRVGVVAAMTTLQMLELGAVRRGVIVPVPPAEWSSGTSAL